MSLSDIEKTLIKLSERQNVINTKITEIHEVLFGKEGNSKGLWAQFQQWKGAFKAFATVVSVILSLLGTGVIFLGIMVA